MKPRKEVRAQRYSVVDARNRERAAFGADEQGPHLMLMDPSGEERFRVALVDGVDEHTNDEVQVMLWGGPMGPAIRLTANADGSAYISIGHRDEGVPQIQVGLDDAGLPGVTVLHPDAGQIVRDEASAPVGVAQHQGRLLLSLSVGSDGGVSLAVAEPDGGMRRI